MEIHYYKYPNTVDNKNAGIEIREEQELTEKEWFLLNQAGLTEYAPLEAWTALGTNSQISYSTHGIFRYFGKFPSTIAAHLIIEYTNEGDIVMDPMAGSGTTALEAKLLNRKCKSYDVNPLSILIQKVKTTHIDEKVLDETLNSIVDNYKPLTIEEFDWQPEGVSNINHWFLPQTQDSLRGLIYLINQIEDNKVKDFFNLCLAATIRPVSRATTQQGRLFLDAATAKEDCLETFVKRAEKAIKAVDSLPKRKGSLVIEEHNAKKPFSSRVKNQLIIIHPPYFNSYRYSSVNSLELAWMRINHADVRKNEVKEFFKVGKAENIERYLQDMKETLDNIVKTLASNGVMALMIGDTIIKGEYLQTTKQLIDLFLADNPTITIEKVIIRVPKYTEASWAASQRRTGGKVGIGLNDFIIVFRRKD